MNAEERVRDLVEEVLDALDLDAEVEVETVGDEINVAIDGDDLGPSSAATAPRSTRSSTSPTRSPAAGRPPARA